MDLNTDSRQRVAADVNFLLHDCSQPWPLPAASLDLVFTSNFFEHLPDKAALQRTLQHIHRALKPGGLLVAIGPNIKCEPGRYWDICDHFLPLTEASLAEFAACRVSRWKKEIERFVPWTMASNRRYPIFLVHVYLRMPWLWRVFGRRVPRRCPQTHRWMSTAEARPPDHLSVYRDEKTVQRVIEKCLDVGQRIGVTFEVLVINDGSPDRAGELADAMAARHPGLVRVIHHPQNQGYGAAIRTGLLNARGDLICFTDGDDEYDVYDLTKLYRLRDYYDLIITFRYVKLYSGYRQFVYGSTTTWSASSSRAPTATSVRAKGDPPLDCAQATPIISNSPFVGAELTLKLMLKGYRIGEVGIQTFPAVAARPPLGTSWRPSLTCAGCDSMSFRNTTRPPAGIATLRSLAEPSSRHAAAPCPATGRTTRPCRVGRASRPLQSCATGATAGLL